MKAEHTPFRIRVKDAIIQAVDLRIFLIQTGKSKNNMTIDHCQKILQDIEILLSDSQLAKYLQDNYPLLEKTMPGPHKSTKANLINLLNEAIKYKKP